jgi:hypothetical protein
MLASSSVYVGFSTGSEEVYMAKTPCFQYYFMIFITFSTVSTAGLSGEGTESTAGHGWRRHYFKLANLFSKISSTFRLESKTDNTYICFADIL